MIRRDFHNTSHWNPIKAPTDVVYLAGQPTPGIAEVIGASSPRAWDEREGYALSGAVVVYHGLKLAHFSIQIRLYTEDDWEAWHRFRPVVEFIPRPFSKQSGAIDIVHPHTQMLGIKSICVEEIMQATQSNDGEWMIELKVIEFRVPVVAIAKPQGAKATPADPEDAILGDISSQLSQHGVNFLSNATLDALTATQP